nr:hypothetical protein [Tanacetum cinerariifolium]
MMFLSTTIKSGFPPINNQLKTSSNPRTQGTIQDGVINTIGDLKANQPRVIRCYICKGKGHIAKQCTAKKRVKDSEWFKEKMLLAQAQEARVILQEEQQEFLADGLEDLDSHCDDYQLHTTSIFKAEHVDAFDSYCDDAPTISAIFMATRSPTRSVNGDVVGLTYDSDILFKCTAKKRVKDSEWFKEKMLLAQAQEARVILQEEQQEFLADGLEDLDSHCDDYQLHTTSIFKAEHVDAFDSYCDDAPTISAIFMATRSPTRSVNGDVVGLTYDSDILFKIVEIVLWYLDSRCSKYMTGQHDKLINFVSKFISTVRFANDRIAAIIGTVKFENDHVAKIKGYGDYKIGNVTISRVYFVEGLGHNLFSVG